MAIFGGMVLVHDEVKEEARIRKSKKTRRILITLIVVLLVMAVVLAGGAVYYLGQRATPTSGISVSPLENAVADTSVSSAKAVTEVPNLLSLFGKTVDGALTELGSSATLVSTAQAADDTLASVTSLATVSLAGTSKDVTGNAVDKAADLYLSLDDAGTIVKVLYVVNLDNLGNGDVSFETALSDADFIDEVLSSAGTGVTDFTPEIPEKSAYQTLTAGTGGSQVVSKESYAYSGATTSSVAPTTWSLTLTYDHSVSNATGDVADVTRTMYVSLA